MENFEILFERKKVRNYCIRIANDGSVRVSVPAHGTIAEAERFVRAKADWILKKREETKRRILLSPDDLHWKKADEDTLRALVSEIFPCFLPYQIPFPTLRFRLMRGRWGSCVKKTGLITLNKMLMLLPDDCREYVIAHELSHLIEANHSKSFYAVLSTVLPDYREREKKLDHFAIARPE